MSIVEMKRLGDAWEKLQGDSSRYTFVQKEKNHLRLLTCRSLGLLLRMSGFIGN